MRLIDADKIMADIASSERSTSKDYSLLSIARYIRIQPTIDAEPVIRCKDCFFCGEIDENGWLWCQCTGAGMPKDGFCSFAERKGWNWGR